MIQIYELGRGKQSLSIEVPAAKGTSADDIAPFFQWRIVFLCIIVAAGFFAAGYGVGSHFPVNVSNSDPYKYCFHLNSSYLPAELRFMVEPGLYAICKIG